MPTRAQRSKQLGIPETELPDGRGKHGNHARAQQAGRWNIGRIVSSHGYIKIRVGKGHPLADPNGYAYEHKLVLITAGIPMIADEVIHHRNGDKTDNRLENLELVSPRRHAMHHNKERARDALGRFLPKAGGRLLDRRTWDQMPEQRGGNQCRH